MPAITINPSDFALAYRRFQKVVEAHPDSDGPFQDFQSGLPAKWEQYKEWLHHEAQRILAKDTWNKRWIGSGRILDHVINAIQIKQDSNHRNNIVEWETKGRPPGSQSHAKLLASRRPPSTLKQAETALFRMYVQQAPAQDCFVELTRLFGTRYDLISYLFFLRNWNEFMPLRSTVFPEVFQMLGVPLTMSHHCNWENYQGFLSRMQEIRRHLAAYNIPGGVRLVDAHSFCWILARVPLPPEQEEPVARVHRIVPEANSPSQPPHQANSGFTQQQLDELQAAQRRVGDQAQRVVLKAEQRRLRREGRSDLAALVEDVSNDTSLGYDIASRTHNGALKPIEVKAAGSRDSGLRFFLSEIERLRSRDLPGYTFALVVGVTSRHPQIFEFPGNDLPPEALRPIHYEVRLRDPHD